MQYIIVSEYEDSESIEIPQEEDGTLLLTTINGIFPRVCGLKYRAPDTNAFRALRLNDGRFYSPMEGWTDLRLVCVFPKDNKRKNEEEEEKAAHKTIKVDGKRCTDLIVLNLGWNVNEAMLREYFVKFGELVLVQVKRDRTSDHSRGYAFIRYVEYGSQVRCLAEKHSIDGRWCSVKVPFSKNDPEKQVMSTKIHVAYTSEDVTPEDLRKKFEQYGDVTDIFVPKPFRGFAFVSFDSSDVVHDLIGQTFVLKGQTLIVGNAIPKTNNVKRVVPGHYQPMNNNDMEVQNQYGMIGAYASPWMAQSYEMQKPGVSQNGSYQGYPSYIMASGNKGANETGQQMYVNNGFSPRSQPFGQYQQYDYNQQGNVAALQQQQQGATAALSQQGTSAALNILNNPEVLAAIVAAVNGSAGQAMGKYPQ